MTPIEMAYYVDSMSVCLSKGLGAPIGSLLIGNKELITKAKRIRKSLGGGMRQSGIVALAGLVGFNDYLNNLLENDHNNIKILANIIKDLPGFKIQEEVQTNILFIHIDSDIHDEQSISLLLKRKNILVSAWSKNLIRVVTHRDISRAEIEYVGAIFKEISTLLCDISCPDGE
jgi:threonine aldolase